MLLMTIMFMLTSSLQCALQQPFPRGEASPHSTGSSRGVTSLGSGHWRQIGWQKVWPYQFSHDISFEFFDHIISEMIDTLRKSPVLHILYFVYKNWMLNNVTIIWDYNNKQLFNSYVKAASYITYLNYYIEILPLAPSIESFRNLVTITKLFVIHKQL